MTDGRVLSEEEIKIIGHHKSPVLRGQEITGMKFGRLTVIEFVGYNDTKDRHYKCVCECGTEVVTRRKSLINGGKKSCGCWYREYQQNKSITHGHGTHKYVDRTYSSWRSMLDRCKNERSVSFDRYGGRGIKVCDRWCRFENFLEDMGERPDGTTLDRIDTGGDYEPKNCKWSTIKEQARNQRRTIYVEFRGQTVPLSQLAEEYGIGRTTLTERIKRGWDVERAVSTPVKKLVKHAPRQEDAK